MSRSDRILMHQQKVHRSLSAYIQETIEQEKDLDEPVSISDPPGCKYPPLIKAAFHDFNDLAKVLVEHKVNVNTTIGMGLTPLHFAAEHNNRALVQLLLEKKADTEVVSPAPIGYTALHYAVENNNAMIVKDLLLAGANANAQILNGYCSLDMLLDIQDITDYKAQQIKNCVYLLLYFGANPNLIVIPEIFFTLEGHEYKVFSNVFNIICSHEQTKNQIFAAVHAGDLQAICTLAKIHTILVRDAAGNTPLHSAVLQENTQVFVLLVSINKQLLDVKNVLGETPLIRAVAVCSGQCTIQKMLGMLDGKKS